MAFFVLLHVIPDVVGEKEVGSMLESRVEPRRTDRCCDGCVSKILRLQLWTGGNATPNTCHNQTGFSLWCQGLLFFGNLVI